MPFQTSCSGANDCPSREIVLELSCNHSISLEIEQRFVGSGTDAVVWDAGIALAQYLSHNRGRLLDVRRLRQGLCGGDVGSDDRRKTVVLDLSAGTGICGLAAAALGADVLLTDMQHALPLIQRNAKLNADKGLFTFSGHSLESSPKLGHVFGVHQLTWGDQSHVEEVINECRRHGSGRDDSQILDVVLIADCVFFEVGVEPLFQTLRSLLSANGHDHSPPLVLQCNERRVTEQNRKAEVAWAEVLKKYGIVTESVAASEQNPAYLCDDFELVRLSAPWR